MIILTAGHTGPNSGAQCATTQFGEGSETIWLRNRVAEILTNKYGLVVLMDDDTASLKLLTKALTEHLSHTDNTQDIKTCLLGRDFAQQKQDHYVKEKSSYVFLSKNPTNEASSNLWETTHSEGVNSVHSVHFVREKESSVRNNNSEGVKSVQICRAPSCAARERIEEKEELKSELSVQSVGDNLNPDGTQSVNFVLSVHSVREKNNSVRDKENSVRSDDFVIDLHFNAHSNPNARGTEAIVADDATTLELRFASHLAHATSDALDIPLRCIKSESETPHNRLAMLHLTPQSIILEVCFCTSPEDVEAYRKNREKLAADLAWAIYELL